MGFTIIIDGPNFINDLHRHGKDKNYILNIFSFPSFHGIIQQKLREEGLASHPFYGTQFICSNKDQIGEFREEEKTQLLTKLMREKGVHVKEVNLSSTESREKAVDITVFSKMLEVGDSEHWKHVVLIASDKDYVPAIEALTNKGIHVILIGFDDGNFPISLINQCYLFLDLGWIITEMETQLQQPSND